MSIELGSFKPYQYSGNKKEGEGQRMAGDMLKGFTQGNVAKVLGASSNKDYRNGVENGPKQQGSNTVANDGGIPAQATSSNSIKNGPKPQGSNSIDYGQYTPESMESIDKRYAENQAKIGSYQGPSSINEVGGNGADYNANLMSYLGNETAVRKNQKYDAWRATHQSLTAGNDHGSGDFKAPQAREYYDYLDTYDGPKSYDAAVKLAQQNNPVTDSNPKTLTWGKEEVDKYSKWYSDTRNYNKAWGDT